MSSTYIENHENELKNQIKTEKERADSEELRANKEELRANDEELRADDAEQLIKEIVQNADSIDDLKLSKSSLNKVLSILNKL